MIKNKSSISNQILIITALIFLIIYTYRNYISNEDYTLQKYITFRKSAIEKLPFINNIDESGKLKELSESIIKKCEKNELCEIKKLHEFVGKIPYIKGNEKVKKPNEVITSNSGDCDEKSFLYTTLLKETKHNAVLIFAIKDNEYHTFTGVQIESPYQGKTYIEYKDKKYYYVETTKEIWKIGEYNGYDKNSIIGIFDIKNNKNIPLKKTKFIKNV